MPNKTLADSECDDRTLPDPDGVDILIGCQRDSEGESLKALHEAATPDDRGYYIERTMDAWGRASHAAYASGNLVDVRCHHYEGIRCLHTASCSIEAKREPCPFDEREAERQQHAALEGALREVIAHHEDINRRASRPRENSRTIAICEAALHPKEETP